MPPAVLTDADHQRFIDDGFVWLEGALNRDAAAAAAAEFERIGQDPEARAERDRVSRSCVSERLLAAVRELHGPRYPVTVEATAPTYIPRVRAPEALHHPGPHMDLIHPSIVPDFWAVGAFVFLTRVRHLGGAFMFSAGSPNRLRAFMSAYSGEAAWGITKDERIAGVVTECLAKPGDAVLFQHPILHSGSENILGETTRHALRFSFPVRPRVSTAGRRFEEMSTIEKANSIRYLRERHGPSFRCYAVEGDVAPFGPVLAHDTLKFDGGLVRFWASPDAPSEIRRARSTDFSSWAGLPPLRLVDDPIISIHLEHRFVPTLTIVTREAGGAHCSRLFESPDLETWRQLGRAPGWVYGRPHFLTSHDEGPFMSHKAAGSVLYFAADTHPNEIRWRSGGSRNETDSWRKGGVAHRAPGAVSDISCRPGPAMYRHVLVADLDGVASYTVSGLQDAFEEPLTPFINEYGPVRQLRCFERAQGFWLVTYLRNDHIRWGEVDWTNAPGQLRELSSARDLQGALALVGLA